MIELGPNRYGKSAIRLVRVTRGSGDGGDGGDGGDRVRDLTIAIALEGDFTAAHTDGDNRLVVATDTMKNTAYAFAAEHLDGAVETYARDLAEHFATFDQVERATVEVREHDWAPIETARGPASDAFARRGGATRLAGVSAGHGGVTVSAGVEELVVMKTTRSSFSGFPRDRYTTLPEAADRLMATKVTAIWRYGSPDVDFDEVHAGISRTLLEVFADHDSPSVQASIWIIGRAMLERHEELAEVRMVLPNLHHWLVDLAPFGLANDREIYVATTEPHGLIEATVRREDLG